MKKNLLALLFLLFCLSGSAQFFALAFDSVCPYVTALPYPMDGNYRVVLYDHNYPQIPQHRTHIKVYNSNLQYVKTINLLNGITLVNDYPPLLVNNKLLWPANYHDTLDHVFNELVILELDTAYQFSALHKISRHKFQAHPTGLVAYSTGYVVGEYINRSTPGINDSTKLYKLNLNLTKKDSVLFYKEFRLKTHASANNKILGAADNLSPACSVTYQTSQKIELDTNLIIVDCFNLPVPSIGFCYNAVGSVTLQFPMPVKDAIVCPMNTGETYLHGVYTGKKCVVTGNYNNALTRRYNGNTNLSSDFYSIYNSSTDFLLRHASDFDILNGNSINVTTVGLDENYTLDKTFYPPYFATPQTSVSVAYFGTGGTIKWRQGFGGDMNYIGRSLAFTNDGGCVVAGSRYKSSTMQSAGVFENFLVKLDSTGKIFDVGITEQHLSDKHLHLYPNPAQELLHINLAGLQNCLVKIYDNQGLIVFCQEVNLAHPISIAMLSPGLYNCQLVSQGLLYSSRFVKQ